MATKSATRSVAQKFPVALFVAAAVLTGYGLVSNIGRADAGRLPDPAEMALVGGGRAPASTVVELWQERVDRHPDSAAFRVELAAGMLTLAGRTGDLGLYPRAEEVARDALAADPRSDAAVLTLASALAGQHDFAEALALAEGVLRRSPGSVGARIAAADAQLELGEYEAAGERYEMLDDELGNEPSILSRRAHHAALTGELDGAVTLARRALIAAGEQDVDTFTGAFYWFQLANYQYQSGQYDEAEESLDSALLVEPLHLGSAELLASVLVAQGRYEEAIAAYESLLRRTDAADLHGELAKLYAHTGRTAEADEQVAAGVRLAHEVADRFPAERRHLIGFLADTDPTFAVDLARRDLAVRSDVQSYAWLAWALLQDDRPAEALEYVGPALRTGIQDAWLLYQVGSVEAANGRLDQAREHLAEALALSPDFDLVHAGSARRLLEDLEGS